MSATNDVVRARIDSETKRAATAILAEIGLTPSDAFRMLLRRTVAERALPFEPLVPNSVTIAAMQEAELAGRPRFASVADLMNDLHASD